MKIDELAGYKAFLASPEAPASAMSAVELEGYLAGLVVAPELIPPSLWLSGIWGGEGPVFDGEAQMRAVFDSVMGHYNAVARRIDTRGVRWKPVYFTRGGQADVAQCRVWAGGFWKAMMIVRDEWLALLDDERTRILVEPFALFADPESREPSTPADDEKRRAYADLIPWLLPELRKLAQLNAGEGAGREPRAPKTGRNEPCPCGSGKKYKRCCGLN
jgi:uncharacterized protein